MNKIDNRVKDLQLIIELNGVEMAPKIIASATAAASWVNRRKASSRNNRPSKKGNDGSDRAASPFSKIGETAKTSVSSSEKSGSSDHDDCNDHYLGAKASKMDANKSRRRPRSTVQKVDQADNHKPSRVVSDGMHKRQQDKHRRIEKQKSKKSSAKTFVMSPPRHQEVSNKNNDRRSRRRNRSDSDTKQKLRNREHQRENNSPASGHKLSRYIEQRSKNSSPHCNSKDDERGGRQKQIASSATATTTNTDDEVSSSTPNKFYQPYRSRNIKSDQDTIADGSEDAAVVMGGQDHLQYNQRSRSKSMPQQESTKRLGTSPLIRKQAYNDTDNTTTEGDDGARAQPKKQLSSFEQQLLQQEPLPLPQSSFDELPRKQLSFEEQLLRQKPLPTQALSFEEQLLHQKPLSGTNLSFEQQLLQQEPPPPFGLPRALSESLGVARSMSDDLTSLSFEQQLRQQPELVNYYNNLGLPPQHVQSSFADATANSDGSSVIYFRNDSGRVILGSQRSMSLPPSLGGGSSGGSIEESVDEDDYDDDDDYDSSTDWSDIERQSQAMSKSRGGVSSLASSSSSSSPQGVEGVTFRHGNVDYSRSTDMPPLARKTTYNSAMEVAPARSVQTSPNYLAQMNPPSLSLLPNQYPLPYQPPTQLDGDTITPEEYQRLQLESEIVRARMLEIEERIRAIESKRGITQGGGVGTGRHPTALSGGVHQGQDNGLRDVGSGQEGSIVWSSSGSEGESEDSYYSDSEEEEDEDTIGDLLSSVSLLNQSNKHRSYGGGEEDENTITPFLSSTSLTMRPLAEEDENEESEEANIEIQKNKMVSVSSLYCEGNSSYVSIATKDEDDSSAAETDHNSEQESEERSTDTTASKRRVRFEDEEKYQSAHYPVSHYTSVQPPPTETNTTDDPMSRHHKPLERKSTHSSTSSASTNMSTLLEHAPLEEHLKGIKQRRSKLLELVEAQDQNRNDSKTKRSIEFSLFLMKDKLNQLQALGVLGEDGEEDLLKSGDARRLLGEIRSDGGTNESE